MLPLSNPEVISAIMLCERAIRRITGNPNIAVSLVDESAILEYSDIENAVCNAVGVTVEEVISKRRTTDYVTSRQLISYYSRMHTSMSLSSIGQKLGNRDHTTVLHNVQKIKNLIQTGDHQIMIYVNRINRAINQLATK